MATGNSGRPASSRAAALIQQYYLQLTQGCGREGCDNPDCATGCGKPLNPNAAATRAVSFATQRRKIHLCLTSDSARNSDKKPLTRNNFSGPARGSLSASSSRNGGEAGPSSQQPEPMDTMDPWGEDGVQASSSTDSTASSTLILVTSSALTGLSPPRSTPNPSSSTLAGIPSGVSIPMELLPSPSTKKEKEKPPTPTPPKSAVPSLTEARVNELLEKAHADSRRDYKELTSTIWLVFSNPESLNQSFLLPEEGLTEICKQTGITVDVKAARRTYNSLFRLEVSSINNTMVNAMDAYCSDLLRSKAFRLKEPLNHFVLLMENPLLHSPEFIKAFPKLLKSITNLPLDRKEALVRWYSHYSTEEIHNFVSSLQQLVTLQLLFSDDSTHQRSYIPQSDASIASAVKVMMIFYFATLMKGEREGLMRPMSTELSSIAAKEKPEFMQTEDTEYERLLSRLKAHPANVLKLPLTVDEFLNEELNNRINMSVDYQRGYMSTASGEKAFSFLDFPFMLNTANKVEKLLRDNLISQYSERQRTFVHSVLTGVPDIPFLLLRIDRNNIVADALVQLEAISELNPIDMRKQLRVEFRGEEGIDEGGLQKEFFQLIIEELFDPMYGMFLFDEDTQQHWFNPLSFEGEEQYRLIGLLLGLAIYNNIILDICFPMVVYCKLLGCTTVFGDLYSSHPQIARSLKSMLEYSGDSFEDTFMATFQVSYSDMFECLHTHDLKDDGETLPVTTDNRQEYVDLYTDWLLNKSIEKSFNAFKKGFDLVMGHNCLADYFRAEELELMVCGSNEWDLDALEDSTRYDGFTPAHPVIVNFWQIVREFSEKEKKQLLAFITGSDRIPLGGLAKLKFIIVKNGPDSDRLPTAHTCFNALLLCDYSSKEKLKERLSKAISYAKGFGMI